MTIIRTKQMTLRPRLYAAAYAALLATAVPQAVQAQDFSPAQRGSIETIVREYLVSHPEVIQEAMGELEKRQTAAEAEKHQAAVKEYSQKLFSSPNQVTLGNPERQRHLRRILRLQLRLLQARHERHADTAQGRSQAQGRAQGIPGARARLRGSGQGRRRCADAGQDRQEIS